MAIYHLSVQVIGKGAGRSAVAAAAYRHCARMERAETGEEIDYSRKGGNVHSEFALPDDAPEWITSFVGEHIAAETSAYFWNAAEAAEKRHDAQLSCEMVLALPEELTQAQNIELVRDFVGRELSARGIVADWAYHDMPGNPHVHVMTSLRPLTDEGFGPKRVPIVGEDGTTLRGSDGKIRYEQFTGGVERLRAIRMAWAEIQNAHLARHGYDVRVDHRSFEDMGIDAVPTKHRGPAADNIDERGEHSELMHNARQAARENYMKYAADPSLVLKKLTMQKAVFTRHDVAREINRTECTADEFRALLLRVGASEELVPVAAPAFDAISGAETSDAMFSTRSMVRLEHEMLESIHGLRAEPHIEIAESRLRSAYQRFEHKHGFALNDEQKAVVRHMTRGNGAAALVGYAGAGKSTTMDALRIAYEREQYKVIGGALAGIAADNLREEAGIESRTLASWEHQWGQGKMLPDHDTVFVMDEAGMVSSEQMARIASVLDDHGAKLIVLGDAKQLQPIQAGAAFRAFVDVAGYVELNNVVRQSEDWMRQASIDFGLGRPAVAVEAYLKHGRLSWGSDEATTRQQLIQDWVDAHQAGADMTIMAHRNKDVIALNHEVRDALQAHGALRNGVMFRSVRGDREFAVGEKVLFLKNERSLDVFNGSTGTVTVASRNRLEVMVEGHDNAITVRANEYNEIDYGYARTIHKEQGNTVDQAFVYLSPTMDAQLAYVALTRHREDVQLYAARSVFNDEKSLSAALSSDRLSDSTVLYRDRVDYEDVVRGFAERRGYPSTQAIGDFIVCNVRYLRERFDRVAAAFAKLRDVYQPESTSAVRAAGVTDGRNEFGRSRLEAGTFGIFSFEAGQQPELSQREANVEPVPEVSQSLAQSLNRLAHNARPIAVGAVRRRGFVGCADYELNLASSAAELRDFNEQVRDKVSRSEIMAQGIDRPDEYSDLLSSVPGNWKEFLVENWVQVFAGQRAEQDHSWLRDLNEQWADQQIENWYQGHVAKTKDRMVPEKPLIPASDIPAYPTAREVREAVFVSPNMTQTRAVAEDVAGRMFKSRKEAVAEITRRYLESPDRVAIMNDIRQQPEVFGDLQGGMRLGFANSKRKDALTNIEPFVKVVSNYLDQTERLTPKVQRTLVEQRAILRRPIQDLSPAADRFIQQAGHLVAMEVGPDRLAAADELLRDKASLNEVQALGQALSVRYGLGQVSRSERMSQDKSLMAIAPAEREAVQKKISSVSDTLSAVVDFSEDILRQDRIRDRGQEPFRGYER